MEMLYNLVHSQKCHKMDPRICALMRGQKAQAAATLFLPEGEPVVC
jgi:hypothetical protein